jgi:hypothetical protein
MDRNDDYLVYDKSVKHYVVTGDTYAHISCVVRTIQTQNTPDTAYIITSLEAGGRERKRE